MTFPGLSDTYVVNQVAGEFSSSTSYAVGDYVNYLGQVYRCTTAHSGTWSSSDFTAVTIADELTDAFEDIDSIGSTITTAEIDTLFE